MESNTPSTNVQSNQLPPTNQTRFHFRSQPKQLLSYKHELLPVGIRCMVYSYLPLPKLIHEISTLSIRDREALVNYSEIINQPRHITVDLDKHLPPISTCSFLMHMARDSVTFANMRFTDSQQKFFRDLTMNCKTSDRIRLVIAGVNEQEVQ